MVCDRGDERATSAAEVPPVSETASEHKHEEPDPSEDSGDIVKRPHLNVHDRRNPGHGLAASRDAEGHLEQEQKDDTCQVQAQAEDVQRPSFFAFARRARTTARMRRVLRKG